MQAEEISMFSIPVTGIMINIMLLHLQQPRFQTLITGCIQKRLQEKIIRLSTELVAGVLVGAALGWLIDRWLGISPWGLIVFLLLGFAAGVLNVMRAAGVSTGGQQDVDGHRP